MQMKKLERAEFLTWIGGGKADGMLISEATALQSGQVAVVEGHPRQAALIVVADENEVIDFFAFVGTYVSSYFPFSAFFRVLTVADFQRGPSIDARGDSVLRRALTGAVICNAVRSASAKRLQDIELSEVLASEEFALARAMMSANFATVDDFSDRWRHAATLVSRNKIIPRRQGLDRFWHSIEDALSAGLRDRSKRKSTALRNVVLKVLEQRKPCDEMWSAILQLVPSLEQYRVDMEGPREKRARAFTSAAQSEGLQRAGEAGDFCVAYLGVLLGGSSLEYASLVASLNMAYPSAATWFGFICGAFDGSDVLTAGRSLGRHLSKHLDEPSELGVAPNCDISFGELLVIARSRAGISYLPTRINGVVSVELIPGVCADFPLGGVRRVPEGRGADPRILQVRRLVQQLQRVVENEPSFESDDLFTHPEKKGRKSY